MTAALGAAVGLGKTIDLVIPTIQAGIQIASFLTASYNLWQSGYLTEQQLTDMWKAAGVSVVAADANLQKAMADAEKRAGA